ncbi:uncharacterized protein LOC125669955 isoform X3 [Ostrea edulis]|uniref:uncharacterized protein LOC125669955 isoform X3 n=1 Tax=Ostrea edulis TaxID=37623 RepID=UPI0024AF7E6D|nr:uncharacterized protein LOC125669955 isoform X3 [Ostrea edulis]
MEFLKVLVVLFVVLHGSLSKPVSSEDELRDIVGELERLATSLRKYVVDGRRPVNSMSGIGLLSGSTPEFPIPGTRLLGPWGLDNDELDPSSPTYKYLHKMFGKLLKPYFRNFPNGPYSLEMQLTPRNVVTMLNAWYNNADQMMTKEQTYFSVARELLDAHFQCATTRINQMVFYVFKDQVRAMAEDDWKIHTRVRKILGNWITDKTVVDKVAKKIVMAAHKPAYGDIMEHIEYFQLDDIVEFLAKMKMLMWKAEQEKWTPVVFDEKLNQLLTDYDAVFQCPSVHNLWEFHRQLVSRVQQRLSETKPFAETKAWLKKVLPEYMTADAITAILQVCKNYVNSAMLHFEQMENHVTSGNTVDINFMSEFLAPHQLQYLQSVFEFLNTGNIRDIMEMEQIRNENIGNGRSRGRCTEFNGECR